MSYDVIILILHFFDLRFRDLRFGTTGVLGGTIIDSWIGELTSSILIFSTISSHKLDELSSLKK